MERPRTIEEAAAVIRDRAAAGRALRPRGGGTKLGWGGAVPQELVVPRMAGPPDDDGDEVAQSGSAALVDVDTRGLDRIVEHNAGDFTAVLEAGVRLADAQATFARAGQMLALDPPLGDRDAATIGGVIATNDSGPARHRYGGARDLVLGITVVLSDGTVAASGGKVIKNVAGYDLAKLFTGSFGTLGLIARVAVRLHPVPVAAATAVCSSADPDRLAAAALVLARLPLEADCLDVHWSNGAGRLLLRFGGVAAAERAHVALEHIVGLDDLHAVTDDAALWAGQRALQRAGAPRDGPAGNGSAACDLVVKVAGRPTDLSAVLRAADAAGATVVSRAGLGLSWIGLPAGADSGAIRRALAPRSCTVLDGSDRVIDPWPAVEPGALAVMERIKARFDPARAFRPGAFVGGI
jgi:glycolate oxidase FAD binding subunit